jgi:hypothetical protein
MPDFREPVPAFTTPVQEITKEKNIAKERYMSKLRDAQEAIDELRAEYQALVQSQFENMHLFVKTHQNEKLVQSSESIERYRRDIQVLDELERRIERKSSEDK